MIAARAAQANIDAMSAHCGADRVHLRRRDVSDADALAAAIGGILAAEGEIDLCRQRAGDQPRGVDSAEELRGLPCGSRPEAPRLPEPQARRCATVRRACGATSARSSASPASSARPTTPPRTTCSRPAPPTAAGALGRDEFTIGWTLWRDVGLGSGPIMKAFLEKSGLFTSMATGEGVHHFIREVNLPRHDPVVVHLGPAERQAVESYRSRVLRRRRAGALAGTAAAARAARGFYLGRVTRRAPGERALRARLHLDTDAYLDAHVVNGYPTLPGTFVTEVGAEAGAIPVPGPAGRRASRTPASTTSSASTGPTSQSRSASRRRCSSRATTTRSSAFASSPT